MLFVFAVTCCNKMPCPLPHNHYCCSLPSPVCLPHLLICTCLISSSITCPPSSVLCWCLLCFFYFLFLRYVTFLCDFILACCFCVICYMATHFSYLYVNYLLYFFSFGLCILHPLTTAEANRFARTFLIITCQLLQLERCSNPLRIQQV